MKIICVGRNYIKHIDELQNEVPSEPVIFLKPETAKLKSGKPFFYPEHSEDIQYEAEIILKIAKNGKHIQAQYAHDYYEEISLGLDLTARDTQTKLKHKGLPWELSKSFDNSAVIGEFLPKNALNDVQNLNFSLEKNGEIVQSSNSSLMIYSINFLISFISKFFTLRQGDILFTGTPEGVGVLKIGDLYKGRIEGKEVLNLKIK